MLPGATNEDHSLDDQLNGSGAINGIMDQLGVDQEPPDCTGLNSPVVDKDTSLLLSKMASRDVEHADLKFTATKLDFGDSTLAAGGLKQAIGLNNNVVLAELIR